MSSGDCTPTPPDFSLSDLWRQAKDDVLTKEVQTSPTYSYQWLADQFGHIALGLLSVLLVHGLNSPPFRKWFACVFPWLVDLLQWLAGLCPWIAARSEREVALWLPLAIFAYVELEDVLEARLRMERVFDSRLDWWNLSTNAVTAFYYMALGDIVAWVALYPAPPALLWLIVIAPLLPRYWLPQKMRFQQAQLPFLFRLPEFWTVPTGTPIAALRSFLATVGQNVATNGKTGPQHLAISGPLGAGKFSLAVGYGTEAAFAKKKVRMVSFDKLQQIACGKEPPPPRNTRVWPWRESQLLIVDDVLPGLVGKKGAAHGPSLATPQDLENALRALGQHMRDCLGMRSVIWVLGEDVAQAKGWAEVLARLFPSNEILEANLPPPPREPKDRGLVTLVRAKLARPKPAAPSPQTH